MTCDEIGFVGTETLVLNIGTNKDGLYGPS